MPAFANTFPLAATLSRKKPRLPLKEALAKIESFLAKAKDVSLGYRELAFVSHQELDGGQIGYRIDADGNSLMSGSDGDWQENWWVIATDELGDPIFVDLNSDNLPVFTAAHGEGSWEELLIANSLSGFTEILSTLYKTSIGRTDPVKFEKKPLMEVEKRELLEIIQMHTPDNQAEYWNIFLTCD